MTVLVFAAVLAFTGMAVFFAFALLSGAHGGSFLPPWLRTVTLVLGSVLTLAVPVLVAYRTWLRLNAQHR